MSDELVQLIGGGTAVAAVSATIGRWLGIRSGERRDLVQKTLERVASLEGRSDALQAQVIAAQEQLTNERVSCAQKLAVLELRVVQLEGENAQMAEELGRRPRVVRVPPSVEETQ